MQCGGDPPASSAFLASPSAPGPSRHLSDLPHGFSFLLLLSPTLSLQRLLFFLAPNRAGSLGPGMTRRLQYI